MPPAKGKVRQEISLTPNQKELLKQVSTKTSKSQAEVIGQMLENYSDSFIRKFS